MKQLRSTLYRLTIVIMTFVFVLSGCSSTEEVEQESRATVIIAGRHSNSQIIDISFDEKIRQTYESFGNIGIIVDDGTPTVERNETNDIIGNYDQDYITRSKDAKKSNQRLWQRDFLEPQVAEIKGHLETLMPDTDEVNTIEAFHEAEKVLATISGEQKDIIICDTGLSTIGALSFLDKEKQQLLFSEQTINMEEVKKLVDWLDSMDEIPDLEGIRVTWYGLGAVADPQEPLNHHYIENLKVIWGEILKRANADPSDVDNTDDKYGYFVSVTSSGLLSFPYSVSTIAIPITGDTLSGTTTTESPEVGIMLTEEKLGFKPETADFLSETTAMETLSPYAEKMLNCPDKMVLVVGTTADPKHCGGSVTLSNERAQKVKNLLVTLGVPEEQMVVLGWGAKEPLYNEAEWNGNEFIEDEAKKNRSVWLLPYGTELATVILNTEA